MEPAKTVMHVSHNDQFTLLFAYSSCLWNKSYTVEPVQGTYIMIMIIKAILWSQFRGLTL